MAEVVPKTQQAVFPTAMWLWRKFQEEAMNQKQRIEELEREVKELRRQLLDLSLRQPQAIPIYIPNPAPAPAAPYPWTPNYPMITCGMNTTMDQRTRSNLQ